MAKLLNTLNGKKTFIVVALGVIIFGSEQMGLVPAGTIDKLDGLLALLGFGTLRHALAQATR